MRRASEEGIQAAKTKAALPGLFRDPVLFFRGQHSQLRASFSSCAWAILPSKPTSRSPVYGKPASSKVLARSNQTAGLRQGGQISQAKLTRPKFHTKAFLTSRQFIYSRRLNRRGIIPRTIGDNNPPSPGPPTILTRYFKKS